MPKKSELEMALACAKKSLEKQIADNPKAGLKLDEDNKMRYKTALVCLEKIEYWFRKKGAFSIGICLECPNFDRTGVQSKNNDFGRCNGKSVHAYDTCDSWGKVR